MSAIPQPILTAAPEQDAQRRRALRRMRTLAVSLLAFAAVVYIVTRDQDGFLGFVNAGAEASMVGAIADWFAVTAIFKHPLGLPIPHTALIPRRKDELGRSLQEFVGENFLQESIIRERMRQPGRPVGWAAGSPRNGMPDGSSTRRRRWYTWGCPGCATRTSGPSSRRRCCRASLPSRSARSPGAC